ncbi:MAG: hypothetical protein Q7U14_07650 [Lacisediminimonas sp.]|nr:hypothetical protein [Lacisediminimonas sp.]
MEKREYADYKGCTSARPGDCRDSEKKSRIAGAHKGYVMTTRHDIAGGSGQRHPDYSTHANALCR